MIASYGQYSAHGVATGTIEFATRAGKITWTSDKCYMQQKGIVPSQRSFYCSVLSLLAQEETIAYKDIKYA